MRCGALSSGLLERTFTYTSQVSGAARLGAALSGNPKRLAAVATRRRVVAVPLCDRCRSHWRRYRWLVAGMVFAFLLLSALLVIWVQRTWGSPLALGNHRAVEVLLLGLLGTAALAVGAAVLVRPPIRAKEITEQTITLTGVSDAFPGAVASRPWWRRNEK
jgi:hypothetical protein